MKIEEMSRLEKPRERMLQYGVENLSNADLISIILRSGTKDNNVKEIANKILSEIGSINNLSNVGVRELSKIKGVGLVKAITLISAIELGKRVSNKEIILKMKLNTPKIINDTFKIYYKNATQEKLMAIFLDTQKCLISYKIIFVGTLDSSIIHPREIFNEAIKVCASSIVLIHNHPSGNLSPSNEDLNVTDSIIKSGKMLGIPVLDHIITNGDEYISIYEKYIK